MKKREEIYHREKREPITSYRGRNPEPTLKRTIVACPKCKDGTLIIIWGKKGTIGKCLKCGTPATANPKRKYDYVECGCCGAYHKPDFTGDCREDANRFNFDQIPEDANILDLEEQMRIEEGRPNFFGEHPERKGNPMKENPTKKRMSQFMEGSRKGKGSIVCIDCGEQMHILRAIPVVWHGKRAYKCESCFYPSKAMRSMAPRIAFNPSTDWHIKRADAKQAEYKKYGGGRLKWEAREAMIEREYAVGHLKNPVGSYSIRLRCPKCARSIEPTSQKLIDGNIELRGTCPNCKRRVGEIIKRNPSKNPPESWHRMRRRTLLDKARYYEDIGDMAKADAYNIAIEEEDIALNQRVRSNPSTISRCRVCEGELKYLGSLGRKKWYRCIDCGLDYSPRSGIYRVRLSGLTKGKRAKS